MKRSTSTPLLFLLLLLSISCIYTVTSAEEWQFPLTAEEALIQQELEWAERAMEGYKRKTGSIPTRSSIRAAHVHTEEWRRDSITLLSRGSSDDYETEVTTRNLRGSAQR